MFPIIQIGPLALQAPGLILLVGLWVGLTTSERLAVRFGAKPNQIYNLVFVALIAGLFGARLSYAFQHIDAFLVSPMSLISLNPGLLDPLGGLAVSLIAAIIYGYRKNIPLWPTLDAITPLLAVIIMADGLADLASGSAFGAPTDVPWGINLWGSNRHPTQIYQILAGAAILGLVWPRGSDSEKKQRASGETFWLFLALSSISWMVIETFRGDSVLLWGGWREAQIIAWIILAVSLWGLWKTRKQMETQKKL